MKKIFGFLLICIIGCSTIKKTPKRLSPEKQLLYNQREGFAHFFKIQVFCDALKKSYQDKEIFEKIGKEDLLGGYDGIAHSSIQEKIDSLATKVANSIKPEEYPDFENKKFIMKACLEYYNSKELDSIARFMAEKYNKD